MNFLLPYFMKMAPENITQTMLPFSAQEADILIGTDKVEDLHTNPRITTESVRSGAPTSLLECCPKMSNGHRDMIPVHEFTRESLPEPYNKIESIYKLTKAMAYLTVRITTTYISEHRPEFLPGSNGEYNYPSFDKRGQDNCPSIGTGRICDVITHKNRKCTCEKCKKSENPSTSCWTIQVFTATHVVFDGKEAKDAKCTLFHGDKKRKKVYLKGFQKKWSDSFGDLCLLNTVTCDKVLSENLFAKIKKFNRHWRELKKEKEEDDIKERLVIIVSHPHGSEKRISIGFGLDIGILQNLGYSKFVYNAPTCPGSSGGPIYILGIDWFETEYVHSGTKSEFKDIEDLVKMHPALRTYLDSTTVSCSSLYMNTPSKTNEMVETVNIVQNENQKWKYSNYSTLWYPTDSLNYSHLYFLNDDRFLVFFLVLMIAVLSVIN